MPVHISDRGKRKDTEDRASRRKAVFAVREVYRIAEERDEKNVRQKNQSDREKSP